VQTIQRIARNLRSSASSFGLSDIVAAAGRIEHAEVAPATGAEDLARAIEDQILASGVAPRRVLVIEDDWDLTNLLKLTLSNPQREIVCVMTGAAALARAEAEDFDLILLDLRLPDMSGQDLLIALRSLPRSSQTPLLVLSAIRSEAARAECFALGADAYFVKPLEWRTLEAAVSQVLARSGSNLRAEQLDGLTGLPNRLALQRIFTRLAALAERTGQPLSLAVIDLDHFKRVNDRHGHAAGDRVLRATVERLNNRLRRSDSLGRWGGEEFVLLLTGTDVQTATTVVRELQRSLSAEPVQLTEDVQLTVSFSGGVVAVRPGDAFERAFEAADRAMYAAKAAGRARVLTAEVLESP